MSNVRISDIALEAEYLQASGLLYLVDGDGGRTAIGRCYSGRGGALNNPDQERFSQVGPIPVGVYVLGAPMDHKRLGPLAIPLTRTTQDPYGRSGFYVHGDNSRADNSASSGCIIATREVRHRLVSLGIRRLTVKAR